MFLSENVIFRGVRLSLGYFGQQASESPVCQLQNAGRNSSGLCEGLTFFWYLIIGTSSGMEIALGIGK